MLLLEVKPMDLFLVFILINLSRAKYRQSFALLTNALAAEQRKEEVNFSHDHL